MKCFESYNPQLFKRDEIMAVLQCNSLFHTTTKMKETADLLHKRRQMRKLSAFAHLHCQTVGETLIWQTTC